MDVIVGGLFLSIFLNACIWFGMYKGKSKKSKVLAVLIMSLISSPILALLFIIGMMAVA